MAMDEIKTDSIEKTIKILIRIKTVTAIKS